MKKTDKNKVTLLISLGVTERQGLFSGMDISKFSFSFAENFEYNPEEKYYSLEGTLEQFGELDNVSKKLDGMPGINWALTVTEDNVTLLIATKAYRLKLSDK